MNKKIEMIKAAESHYNSLLNRIGLDINKSLECADSNSLDSLIDSIQNYTHVLNQFNFVQKLKENIAKTEDNDEG